jgi:putative ABC transport system permease protein
MRTLWHDLRYALRLLAKSPSFTTIAVLTLAVGIGANTAIFSVIYGVLIRPLAVPEANQVVQVVLNAHGELNEDNFTYNEFRYIQEHSHWPAAIAAFTHVGFNMSTGGEAHRVSALHVSSDYFRVLGSGPSLGRVFTREEDRDANARVVILAYHLWQHQFAADPSVIGKTIHLNGAPYQVIGVMPSSSSYVQLDWVPPAFGELQHVDLWTTLAPVADSVGAGENLSVIARINPSFTLVQASSQLDALTDLFRQQYLEGEAKQQSLALSSVQKVLAADTNVGTYLWILLAAVAFVLLIACANISNLLLAKGAARTKEVAVRAAMGANRGRLIRQFLSESLVLAAWGGLFGFLVANGVLYGLLRFAPMQLPRVAEIRVDGWAFLFALSVTIFAGALSGIVPAFHAAKADVSLMLKESGAQTSGSRRSGRFRGVLVVTEIALSLILLISASLLGESFLNLLRVNPGFQPSGVLSAEIWLTGSRIHSSAELTAFYDALTARLKQLPGVQQATLVSMGQPLERGGNIGVTVNGADFGSMNFRVIAPDYFQTLRAALKSGRDFSPSDAENTQPVVIVNQAFVRTILKDSDPFVAAVQISQQGGPRRIVGVVADIKSHVERSEGPVVFLPASQTKFGLILGYDAWFPTHILVRTSGDPLLLTNQVSAAIRETDSSIPVGRILSMEQVLGRSLATQRFMMVVVAVFAVLALVLAAIGIYGVISFSVSQRTHELGIRMALGAPPSSVLSLVLRDGTRLALLGAAAGIMGAIVLRQAIASVLFGVQPGDWRTILGASACLLVVALLASFIPARRATKVDPMVALRYE